MVFLIFLGPDPKASSSERPFGPVAEAQGLQQKPRRTIFEQKNLSEQAQNGAFRTQKPCFEAKKKCQNHAKTGHLACRNAAGPPPGAADAALEAKADEPARCCSGSPFRHNSGRKRPRFASERLGVHWKTPPKRRDVLTFFIFFHDSS